MILLLRHRFGWNYTVSRELSWSKWEVICWVSINDIRIQVDQLPKRVVVLPVFHYFAYLTSIADCYKNTFHTFGLVIQYPLKGHFYFKKENNCQRIFFSMFLRIHTSIVDLLSIVLRVLSMLHTLPEPKLAITFSLQLHVHMIFT